MIKGSVLFWFLFQFTYKVHFIFLVCCKIHEINYKEEFTLAHSFGGFSPWFTGPIAFGPIVRQNIMMEKVSRSKAHFMETEKKKQEKKLVSHNALPRHIPNSPTRPHLFKVSAIDENKALGHLKSKLQHVDVCPLVSRLYMQPDTLQYISCLGVRIPEVIFTLKANTKSKGIPPTIYGHFWVPQNPFTFLCSHQFILQSLYSFVILYFARKGFCEHVVRRPETNFSLSHFCYLISFICDTKLILICLHAFFYIPTSMYCP